MDDGKFYRDQIRSAIANLVMEAIDLVGRCHVESGETYDEAAKRTASESVLQMEELRMLLDDFSKAASECKKEIKRSIDVAQHRLCVLSQDGEISGARMRELTVTPLLDGLEEDEDD